MKNLSNVSKWLMLNMHQNQLGDKKNWKNWQNYSKNKKLQLSLSALFFFFCAIYIYTFICLKINSICVCLYLSVIIINLTKRKIIFLFFYYSKKNTTRSFFLLNKYIYLIYKYMWSNHTFYTDRVCGRSEGYLNHWVLVLRSSVHAEIKKKRYVCMCFLHQRLFYSSELTSKKYFRWSFFSFYFCRQEKKRAKEKKIRRMAWWWIKERITSNMLRQSLTVFSGEKNGFAIKI
jgi:hypothetical protein